MSFFSNLFAAIKKFGLTITGVGNKGKSLEKSVSREEKENNKDEI